MRVEAGGGVGVGGVGGVGMRSCCEDVRTLKARRRKGASSACVGKEADSANRLSRYYACY